MSGQLQNNTQITFKKVIVYLLYTALILTFLSGPLRRLSPWIKQYHILYGLIVLGVLLLLHLWSVYKSLAYNIMKRRAWTSGSSLQKLKYNVIVGLTLSLVVIIVSGATRKIHPFIRDIHTIYMPIIFTALIILHVYSVTCKANSTKYEVRKDYKGFLGMVAVSLPIISLIAISIIIFQKLTD